MSNETPGMRAGKALRAADYIYDWQRERVAAIIDAETRAAELEAALREIAVTSSDDYNDDCARDKISDICSAVLAKCGKDK